MGSISRRDTLIAGMGLAASAALPGLDGLGRAAGGALAVQPGGPLSTAGSSDWIMKCMVNVRSYQPLNTGRMPRTEGFGFGSAAVVYPLVDRTAASQLDLRGVKGHVELNDERVTDTYTVLEGYHSGVKLARFDLTDVKAHEMELHIELPTRCYRTRFDEDAAGRIGWPSRLPAAAESTFQPQMFINYDQRGEYDMKLIQRMVKQWTGGNPKQQPPYTLVKWLTGQVINTFQVSGEGLNFDRSGMIEGMDIEGAAVAAQRRRGSPFDMAAFYVAVLREAGVPARLVVGYDKGSDEDAEEFRRRNDREPALHAWAEWYLHDDGANRGWWIPADPVRARRKSSRMPNNFMDRPVPYLGGHDELDGLIPLAFHYHPPTTVRAYNSPGLWGWFSLDNPPDWAYQGLTFDATTRASRAGEQPFRDDRRR